MLVETNGSVVDHPSSRAMIKDLIVLAKVVDDVSGA